MKSTLEVKQDEFIEQNLIGKGVFSITYLAIQKDTLIKFSKKNLKDVSLSYDKRQFISFFASLSEKKYQCFAPPSFISFDQKTPIIYTMYAENKSLQYIIQQQMLGESVECDNTQEYLILYGISHFLESFHEDGKVHGNIKLSNILLNDVFFPFVSDPKFSQIIQQPPISSIRNKTIDYLVSISPEELNGEQPTQYSDIYSFGILILQVLTHRINIYTNDDKNIKQIEEMIINKTKPEIPSTDAIPHELSKILKHCFSSEPTKSPTSTDLKKVFEQILSEESNLRRFNNFKSSMPYQEISTNEDVDLMPIDPTKLRSIWAIDCSGSVRYSNFYHTELESIVNDYHKDTDEIFFWSGKYEESDYEGLKLFIEERKGKGDTLSSLIAEIINQSSIREHLIIVTDGQVDTEEINLSDQLMRRYRIKFKYVTVFIINQNSDSSNTSINISVGIPYSRGCQNTTYLIRRSGTREIISSLTYEDISSLKNMDKINSYEAFCKEFNNLNNAIQALTLGKDGYQDPLVYFQIKNGITINYGVTIIIDPCFTCFDDFSERKSLQSIGVIQSSITQLDIAYFDIIIADKHENMPNIVHSEKGTISTDQARKKFRESLFNVFKSPINDADIYKAIKTSIEIKKNRKTDYKCIILVLTKKLLDDKIKDGIINEMCEQKDISIYGIGDGIYPKNTEKKFPKVAFDHDPTKIKATISSVYKSKNSEKPKTFDPSKVNTVWAIDASESVCDNDFYHKELESIFQEYYKEGDIICLWHKYLRKISPNELIEFIKNRRGFSGSKPSVIAHISYHTDLKEHLIIVTDGTVDNGEIDKSEELVKAFNFKFNFVTVFFIHDENPPLIQRLKKDYKLTDKELDNYRLKCDYSMAEPFTRCCPNVTFSIKKAGSREKLTSLTQQDLDALDNIGDIKDYSDFEELFNHLDKAIQNATSGKEKDSTLSGQLDSLYKRITSCHLTSAQKADFEEKFNQLKRMAEGALRNTLSINEINAAKKGI